MLKMIFQAMLQGASDHYGDSIGLSPVAFASPKTLRQSVNSDSTFWKKECSDSPHRLACLNYES